MLKLNVGLNKKVGESNFGSRGASVNLETELDSALIGEPDKLRDRIRQLFALARASLTEELNGNGQQAAPSAPSASTNGQAGNANGAARPPRHSGQRLATQSQLKAIQAICKSQKLYPLPVAQAHFGVQKIEELTIQEASQLIDELKASQAKGG